MTLPIVFIASAPASIDASAWPLAVRASCLAVNSDVQAAGPIVSSATTSRTAATIMTRRRVTQGGIIFLL